MSVQCQMRTSNNKWGRDYKKDHGKYYTHKQTPCHTFCCFLGITQNGKFFFDGTTFKMQNINGRFISITEGMQSGLVTTWSVEPK